MSRQGRRFRYRKCTITCGLRDPPEPCCVYRPGVEAQSLRRTYAWRLFKGVARLRRPTPLFPPVSVKPFVSELSNENHEIKQRLGKDEQDPLSEKWKEWGGVFWEMKRTDGHDGLSWKTLLPWQVYMTGCVDGGLCIHDLWNLHRRREFLT